VLSLGAALTGFFDWWKGLDRRPNTGPIGKASHTQVWRTVNWHMTVMLTVTVIVIIDIVVRLGQYDRHYATLPTTVLSVLAGLLVVYGAGYGGSLVFDYQFNVEGLKGSTAWDESEVDQLPGKKS
ncbi:MAG: putative rane protein, partial [Actinomycetota bacterium]|nr:putative rane protein [Actinomycetota bacterium]